MSYALNMPVIKLLIHKDLFLQRKTIALYLAGGIFALSFISLGQWQFFMGTTLLISILVGLGNHQISNTIISERKEHTLPFIMSLPITPIDYALAKLTANMALFVVPWALVVAATVLVFLLTSVPDGLIPIAVILAVYFLLCYCITWAAGMISESEGAVLFVMIFMNCMIGPVIYFTTRIDGISQHIFGAVPVWNSYSLGVIGLQLVLIILALVIAFVWQARKKTFL